jgi:hypothetical protein
MYRDRSGSSRPLADRHDDIELTLVGFNRTSTLHGSALVQGGGFIDL